MKYLKMLGFAAIAAAALMAFAGTASATELTCKNGSTIEMCPEVTAIHAEAEGHAVLDPIIGKIECASTVAGKTTNTGSSSETVDGPIETLTFPNCTNGAVVTVLKKGELIIHTRTTKADGNGTLTSNGAEVEVRAFGFNCIFSTSNTDIGTLTGSKVTKETATLDIEATIPRTGGLSGGFCGATAQWTGSYKVDTPDYLDVD